MAILRTEKAMRIMCGVKMIQKRSQKLSLLGLKDTLDGLARASGVRWCRHVLRRALGRRGRGRPNITWKSMPIRLD